MTAAEALGCRAWRPSAARGETPLGAMSRKSRAGRRRARRERAVQLDAGFKFARTSAARRSKKSTGFRSLASNDAK